MIFDVPRAEAYAAIAHAGQTDKLGVPYIEHVRAVASGVAMFGTTYAITGLLHDILEDTELTAADLEEAGVGGEVIDAVVAVTRTEGTSYDDYLGQVLRNPVAVLVKIADNAHNSRPDRLARLPLKSGARLSLKYRQSREVLWEAAPTPHIEKILETVNPALLPELRIRKEI